MQFTTLMKEKDLAKPIHSFKFIVSDDDLPARIDKFLAQKMPWRSRTFFQKMIASKEIIINGKNCRSGRCLCSGDTITVDVSNYQQDFTSPDKISINKIYEDNDILVLNKSPGIIVHPTGRHLYNTLMNAVHSEYSNANYRPRLVHRLDKDTSGVLVLAKNEPARSELARQIENRKVTKNYLALAHGVFSHRSGEINLPIGQDNYSHIRLKQEISETAYTLNLTLRLLLQLRAFWDFLTGSLLLQLD